MEEKRKKIGMDIKPSLHQALVDIANRRRVRLWQVTQECVEGYLGRPVMPCRGYPDDTVPLHDTLAEILRHGPDRLRVLVKAALDCEGSRGEGARPRRTGRSRKVASQ